MREAGLIGFYLSGGKLLIILSKVFVLIFQNIFRHVSHYLITYYLPSGLFVIVSWIRKLEFLFLNLNQINVCLIYVTLSARTIMIIPAEIVEQTFYWLI